MSYGHSHSVKYTGAAANELIVGLDRRNRGLIIKLESDQEIGAGRYPKGKVEVLDSGNGEYSNYFEEFVGQILDGRELHDSILERVNKDRRRDGKTPRKHLTVLDVNSLGRLLTLIEALPEV